MDGVPVGGGGFEVAYDTDDGPLFVGGSIDCVLDEIAVYDRVLSREEIAQLRNRAGE